MKLSALCQGAESDLHSAYVAVLADGPLAQGEKAAADQSDWQSLSVQAEPSASDPTQRDANATDVDRQPEVIRVLTIQEVVDRGVLAFRNADAECRWWHACFDCLCTSFEEKHGNAPKLNDQRVNNDLEGRARREKHKKCEAKRAQRATVLEELENAMHDDSISRLRSAIQVYEVQPEILLS